MADLLIRDLDLVVTLDDEDRLLRGSDLAVRGPSILALGAPPPDFTPEEVVDGRGKLALPGLFNAHCHAAMTLERGFAEDLPFDRWLNEKIWVAESALEEEDVYWGTALAACEMIRAGVVGFADHYFWMDQAARAVEESGLKALLAWCHFGLGPDQEVGGVSFEATRDFAAGFNGAADGRVRTAMGPHSPYMCSPETLSRCAEAAGAIGVPVHLHLAESAEQVAVSRQKHGRSPIAHVAARGVFDGPAIAAHCIALDDADVSLLAEREVSVAHTPKTYMKLAMGMTPVQRLLDAGVNVALGTDGPASNSDLDLLQVARLTGLLQKWIQGSAEALPLTQLLRMASTAGARALGFSSSGVIAPGAAADLVLVRTGGARWAPGHDPVASLVYASQPADVTDVLVNGAPLLRDGALTTLDEERICREATRRARRMVGTDMAQLRRYQG